MKKLIARIEWALKARGVQKQELAKAIKVNVNTVSKWMEGKNTPKTVHIHKIAKHLKISLDWLLDDEAEDVPGQNDMALSPDDLEVITQVIGLGDLKPEEVHAALVRAVREKKRKASKPGSQEPQSPV